MTDTVRLTTGGQPQRFSFALPGQPPQYSTTTNNTSAPIPKDGTYSTYEGWLQGTTGTQSATMTFQCTNDPHTAGSDDPSLTPTQRNNFQITTTNTSTAIGSVEGLFRPDMNGDEVYAVGVTVGTTMTYVSATSATLSAAATVTGIPQARFQALHWVLLGTLTLTGTLHAEDGFATAANWKFVRMSVSSLTGTGAAAFATQGT